MAFVVSASAACIDPYAKMNGVFYDGSIKPAKELFFLSKVYLKTPQKDFYPSVFKWNYLKGLGSLTVYHPDRPKVGLYSYDFNFDLSAITVEKVGEKTRYLSRLQSTNEPTVWMVVVVDDYLATIGSENYTYEFDRRDMELSFIEGGQYIGWFEGAQMTLKQRIKVHKQKEEDNE